MKISRRSFIGTAAGLGGITLAATTITPTPALAVKPKNAMLIDVSKCIGCMRCVAACAEYHKKYYGQETDGTVFTTVPLATMQYGKRPTPQNCMHCIDAPCATVCQSRALEQLESGAVIYHEDRCIGCFLCTTVCPFESITTDLENKKIFKCDLCSKITENGGAPSCVTICPTQSKSWGPYEEKVKEGQETAERNKGKLLYANDATVIYVLSEYEYEQLRSAPEVTVIKPEYPSEYKSYSLLVKWSRVLWIPFLAGAVFYGLAWRGGKTVKKVE
ncbi:MAG: 4Fe-4S dicluster domain-containing protein [Nitrososphaerales archaeon]